VIYNNGPIEAALAYARHIDFQTYDGSAWRAHAAYNFGFLKLLGAYERMKYEGNNGTSGDATARYYSIGIVVPMSTFLNLPGTLRVVASCVVVLETHHGSLSLADGRDEFVRTGHDICRS